MLQPLLVVELRRRNRSRRVSDEARQRCRFFFFEALVAVAAAAADGFLFEEFRDLCRGLLRGPCEATKPFVVFFFLGRGEKEEG